MVQSLIVNPDYDDVMSFAESSESVIQVREDTPPLPVQRRLFGTAVSAAPSTTPSSQSLQRRGSKGLRSLCCGLFPRRRRRAHAANNSSSAGPETQGFAPMMQRVPVTHATIFEEDEDEHFSDQENQPPTLLDSLIHADEHDGAPHEADQADQEADQELDEEYDEEQIARRRRSLRHSWITVSRWLE
jgi:hypothetical protein